MDINDKKLFIYKNINNINNHNVVIDYIKNNDIKYTHNNNGFFVNISLIDDHIDNLYNILQYYININNNEELIIDKRKQFIIDNFPKKKNNKKYNIPLAEFSETEQEIIKHSKQFKI
jgi:hypothetical protein